VKLLGVLWLRCFWEGAEGGMILLPEGMQSRGGGYQDREKRGKGGKEEGRKEQL